MSADATTTAEPHVPVHDVVHHHPTDSYYVRIAVALAVITGLEVAWSYLPVWDDATGATAFLEVAGLMVMMAIKFVVVASNFMHLKFDNKVLTRIFYFGLLLAAGVYLAVLFTFEVINV
jgi:cytochrome c oxidase subunit 4